MIPIDGKTIWYENNFIEKGPKQLTTTNWEKLFTLIESFGIMSNQPRYLDSYDLGDGRVLFYFPEISSERFTKTHIPEMVSSRGGTTDEGYFASGEPGVNKIIETMVKMSSTERGTGANNSGDHWRIHGPKGKDTQILLVGVSYPASPVIHFPDEKGILSISTAKYEKNGNGGYADGELNRLVNETKHLVETPLKSLLQGTGEYSSSNRYFGKLLDHQGTMIGSGNYYDAHEDLFGIDDWDKKGKLRPKDELIEAQDTNGRIFIVVGKLNQEEMFASINYKVIG
tara:strand:- start:1544 stop:2395 length:852 start_codon:yes stop_codon:yes gene_type:complete